MTLKRWKTSGRSEWLDKARAARAEGVLITGRAQTLIKRAGTTPLQFQASHVDADTAMRGWRLATPEEPQHLQAPVLSRILNSKTPPADR
jgi:hypothetical protein